MTPFWPWTAFYRNALIMCQLTALGPAGQARRKALQTQPDHAAALAGHETKPKKAGSGAPSAPRKAPRSRPRHRPESQPLAPACGKTQTPTFFPAMRSGLSRKARLQDLEARMTSFLSEKQVSSTSCPKVLDNIKVAKSAVQREMAAG